MRMNQRRKKELFQDPSVEPSVPVQSVCAENVLSLHLEAGSCNEPGLWSGKMSA